MSARIPSPNYSSGRAADVRVVVLHTAETPCEPGRARGIANYLAGAGVGASCHWAVDPDDEVAQVDEDDTAWAAPGANSDGVQIEQAGYAGYGPAEWAGANQQRMLERTARLVAGICQRHNLPIKALTNAELDAGQAGIVQHVQVSEVYQRSDHWDCGPHYPIDQVVARARQIAGGAPVDPDQAFWEALMADARIDTLISQVAQIHKYVVDPKAGGIYSDLLSTGQTLNGSIGQTGATLRQIIRGEVQPTVDSVAVTLAGAGRAALVTEIARATAANVPTTPGMGLDVGKLATAIVDELFARLRPAEAATLGQTIPCAQPPSE